MSAVGLWQPNDGAIIRLVGAVLADANDLRPLQYRYMQGKAMTELTPLLPATGDIRLSTAAA